MVSVQTKRGSTHSMREGTVRERRRKRGEGGEREREVR